MAYVQVECSVPRNDKFQKAGPGASWLWLCGLCYCQDGLTDGYIPESAIDYLGVKNARRFAEQLVSAGLWHREPGGWRVHDYLKHNKSAIQVRLVKDRRRIVGSSGGIASGEARRSTDTKQVASTGASTVSKQVASTGVRTSESKQAANPIVDVAVAASVAAPSEGGPGETAEDSAFARFREAYPSARRKGGYLVEQLFLGAFEQRGEQLFATLENHKKSEQWQNPKLIPGMDLWFKEERWRQTLPPKYEAVGAKKPFGTWRPQEAS